MIHSFRTQAVGNLAGVADLLWCDVASSCSDSHVRPTDFHVEAVQGSVFRRRGECHQVLVMQLVCDARKRRR
jgi:hypothetical protein